MKVCTKDGCVTIGARTRPVNSDVKTFEDVEGVFFSTYGRFVRGPVDKQSRIWREVPGGAYENHLGQMVPAAVGRFLRSTTIAVDPPGWRPVAQTNPYAVTVVPRKDWKHKDTLGFWTHPVAGNPGITIPDDAAPSTMFHEIIHSWTAYRWWRYALQGSWARNFNDEDVERGHLPKPRWTYMQGHAMTESMTQHLTNEAGFPSGSYAPGVQYLQGLGIPRDVWAAALFGADIEELERAISTASGSKSAADAFVECAMRLGGSFISEVNPRDRR